MSPQRLAALAATVVVSAALVAAVAILDSPQLNRQRRLDQRRTSDLERLSFQVEGYYRTNKQLPPDLASLASGLPGQEGRADPETGAPYEYAPLDGHRYRLCAVFRTAGDQRYYGAADSWNHPQGRYCFTRRAG